MKGFIKSVLATIVGIVVFVIIAGIFGVMSIVGMVSRKLVEKNTKGLRHAEEK